MSKIKIHNTIARLQRIKGELALLEKDIAVHINAGGNHAIPFRSAESYCTHARGHLFQAIELLDNTRKATS